MSRIARVLAATVLCVATAARAAEEPVRIELEAPAEGEATSGVQGMGIVGGRVLPNTDPDVTDLMFVIDVSDSTIAPSGGDIDGDGKVRGSRVPLQDVPIVSYVSSILYSLVNIGGLLTDDGDSVLAAELAAVRNLLDQLDPKLTRVGVIAFSGDTDPSSLDADVIAPLTSDYATLRRALDAEQERGPRGRTNFLAAISLATVELSGTRSARSEPRENARKVMLFLTDGRPTLPLDAAMADNREAAVDAARRAARSGIRIRTYGVGQEVNEDVLAADCLREIARVGQGSYTQVTQPSLLRAEVSKLDLVEVGQLEIENLTTGARAVRTVQSPDGHFFALVPMQPGANSIQVSVRTAEGSTQRRFDVELREEGSAEARALQDPLAARMRSELVSAWIASQTAP